MTAHTPGPWQTSGVRSHMDGEEWLTIITSDGNAIAYVPYSDLTPSLHLEAHADQRLIAATPDLLECATNLLDCISYGSYESEEEAKKRLRDAIDKATGEKP